MAPRAHRPGLRLAVLGAINWDTTIFVDGFALPGEEVAALRLEEGPGGKGANAAVAAARILGPGSVAFLGALGDDSVSGPLVESLGSEGVRTDGVVVLRGLGSGRAVIVVDSLGRKAIHTHFGANERFRPKHVSSPGASAVLSAAEAVAVMDVPPATALAAAEASGARSRVIYSPGVRSSGPEKVLASVATRADDLVLDRSELARMSGTDDPREGVERIQARFPGLVVVATLGPDGCLVSRRGEVKSVRPVDLADLGTKAVNSTGSGDAFLAAYACYSMMGLPPEEAALWGNLAGALKAASAETRGSPQRRELEESMSLLNRVRRRRRG